MKPVIAAHKRFGIATVPVASFFSLARDLADIKSGRDAHSHHICRSSIIVLISLIALAGFSPFGQVLAQFMIVWQR